MTGRADYQERKDERIERLKKRAENTAQEANARFDTAHRIGSRIPFGQPILIGHHSESRHRRDADKINANMRAGCELMEKAKEQKLAAEGAEKNLAISSDNPAALLLLKEKLVDLENTHLHMKLLRQAFTALQKGTLDKSKIPDQIKQEARNFVPGGNYFSNEPVMAYRLTNSSANIRAMIKRISELEKMAEPAKPDFLFLGGMIRDNKEFNRVQVIFDDAPDEAARATLKSRGFKWAPSQSAWQRMRTEGVFNLAVWLMTQCISGATL